MQTDTESSTPSSRVREQEFAAFFAATYADLLRFVQRRIHPVQAEDVVADVYLVVWRRFDQLPEPPGQRKAWLFGIARRTLFNAARGHGRQHALAVRLINLAPPESHDSTEADLTALRVDISAAWPRLSAVDQEALCLSVLDGLDAPSAARVLGITPVAFRLRLSRARRALRARINPSHRGSPLESTKR